MKKTLVIIFAILIGISFISCTKESSSKISIEETVSQDSILVNTTIENTEEFIVLLEKSGYKTNATKEKKTNFLSGNLTTIDIDGNTIGVWEYKNNKEMELDAKTIGIDGSTIGNTIYEFTSSPHFYKSGNIIASYFGDNKAIIKTLEKLMGQQFAGRFEI